MRSSVYGMGTSESGCLKTSVRCSAHACAPTQHSAAYKSQPWQHVHTLPELLPHASADDTFFPYVITFA